MNQILLLRARAEADVQAIYDWYESKQSQLGEEFLTALGQNLERIREQPELYPILYKNVRRALLRKFPYLVFFTVTPTRILVLAVLHASRDPAIWPRR
jgi:plasmid stabilization system protein ParE